MKTNLIFSLHYWHKLEKLVKEMKEIKHLERVVFKYIQMNCMTFDIRSNLSFDKSDSANAHKREQ